MAQAPTTTPPPSPAVAPEESAPAADETAAGTEGQPESESSNEDEPVVEMSSAVVPVDPEPRLERGRRLGFWKRLSLRRRSAGEPISIDAASRMRALEDRVGDLDRHLESRIDALEGQLTQFWAIDERLGKLEEIEASVAELHKTQVELVQQLRRNGRALRLLGVFALLVALAVGLLTLG